MLAINLKSYKETIGSNGLKLLEASEKIIEEYNIDIILAPQYTDIYIFSSNSKRVRIYAQHMDPIQSGAYTGHILPEAIKEAGAVGTIINHSEKKLNVEDIEKVINIAKNLNLETILCANNSVVAAALSKFEPTYIAVEPPELIGTGIPVSKAKPEIIENTVNMVRDINKKVKILVGAGINSGDDIKKALELGANGVLLASAVTKSSNFYEKLKNLAEGFK
ncbi:triosephosphate isomerase [Nanobdella aerobiophila]|uniref:Triosephosphate isomerase n=1 Tax=Nanobdella aerobiophila TaxID=2586965 RepID=A0A915SCW0_9ARCH|nr:triose-phosphate isomerase [Nanobdella aerobiophila]BBL45703.1 triosephosphate isomerase [Nanobdella aerobiophila]